jgi:hemolysin III
MHLFDVREPINACSHGAGMMLALLVTCILWKRCGEPGPCGLLGWWYGATRYRRIKALCLVVFGVSLTLCYGVSAAFHAAQLGGEPLIRLQRLDHVGIYLLIAGTYTPVAWSLLRGSWWWGTLTTVWTVAAICAAWEWWGGAQPVWASTLVYLTMGWGALFCYRELARTHSHRTLLPLPLGGVFYSVGALINLARWPVLYPGFFAAHELFHFLVIAGSTCHIGFMLMVVVPALEPDRAHPRSQPCAGVSAPAPRRVRDWRPHFNLPPRWARGLLIFGAHIGAGDPLEAVPPKPLSH